MSARLRRRAHAAEAEGSEEGPFVSFTDLSIGIIFLFLILVAALMLMHMEAVRKAEEQARIFRKQIAELQARLDEIARLDAEHPPFRLAIVYNSYQKVTEEKGDWTFSRTVQIFRSPNGLCLYNIYLRNNLSLAWMPPVKAESIPTPQKQDAVRMGTPCTLTAAGEHWNTEAETGGVQRAGPNLYTGSSTLHKKDGMVKVDIQYRVLGVYDPYFGQAIAPSPKAPDSKRM